MKRFFRVSGLAIILAVLLLTVSAGVALAVGPAGPAPNSGDCVPDGSGFDRPLGPFCNQSDNEPKGPAPNSGDGIPDGSGF